MQRLEVQAFVSPGPGAGGGGGELWMCGERVWKGGTARPEG